ncbi:hypothetical protein AGMMS49579_26550 [Spirochaetia bacterium]|nr:hypothetical protein AGMMS49579_26550 [Spirochaetia bacterium]
MRLRRYSFNYSKTVLFGMLFLYLIVPLFLQNVIGEKFYIYSQYQFFVAKYSCLFFIGTMVVLLLLIRGISKCSVDYFPPINKNVQYAIIALCIIYELSMIMRGIPLRMRGASRLELLDLETSN